MKLIEQYGLCDIGIIFTFFFNILKMKIGDSFVISPDEPHAYISGELIEAMVNSDNVVRGGLTPKFKDTKTLEMMLKYEFKERKSTQGETTVEQNGKKIVEYKTGFAEFMVTHLTQEKKDVDPTTSLKFNSPAIAIVLSGSASTNVNINLEPLTAYFIVPDRKSVV